MKMNGTKSMDQRKLITMSKRGPKQTAELWKAKEKKKDSLQLHGKYSKWKMSSSY